MKSNPVERITWGARNGSADCEVCGGPLLRGDPVVRKGARARHEWCRFPSRALTLDPDLAVPTCEVTEIRRPLLLESGLILYDGRIYDPAIVMADMPWLTVEDTMELA